MPPIGPDDFLKVAARLMEGSPAEIDWRCAASRAYYAALHGVDAALPAGTSGTGGADRLTGESSHEAIIRRATALASARLPGGMYAAPIAKLMPRLRRLRNKADYGLRDAFPVEEATFMLASVQRVLENCQDLKRMRQSHNANE